MDFKITKKGNCYFKQYTDAEGLKVRFEILEPLITSKLQKAILSELAKTDSLKLLSATFCFFDMTQKKITLIASYNNHDSNTQYLNKKFTFQELGLEREYITNYIEQP